MKASPKNSTLPSSTSLKKDTINNPPAPVIIYRKKKMWKYEAIKTISRGPGILSYMKETKADGYLRQSMMGSEIIWEDAKFKIPNKEGYKNRDQMIIFSMVARNAYKYADTHTIKKYKVLPSERWNEKFDYNKRYKMIGTDLNSAYWNIAFKMGVIAQTTYVKGRDHIQNKAILLASLASLGSDKTYQVIEKGMPVNKYVILKGNDDLKEIYKKIRNKCYEYMNELAALLGKDFISYRTDCIYYRHTAANVKKITTYLNSKKLDDEGFAYKMLMERRDKRRKKHF